MQKTTATNRLGWSFILLLFAFVAFVTLPQFKVVIGVFCNDHSDFDVLRGELWSNYLDRSDYDIRLVYETADELEVSYDMGASLCLSPDLIPVRIHLKNRTAGQGVQFGVEIFVEAPTGQIIGRFGFVESLAYEHTVDSTATYNVSQSAWRGYSLIFHPIVWIASKSSIYLYKPFVAWTLPSWDTLLSSGEGFVRFWLYLVSFAPLLPVLAPESLKGLLQRQWQKLRVQWKAVTCVAVLIVYWLFWSLIVGVQFASP